MSYPLADFIHAVRPRVDARLLPPSTLDVAQQAGQWFPFVRDVQFRCRLAAHAPLASVVLRLCRADAARASLPEDASGPGLHRVLDAFQEPSHALFLAGELVTVEVPAPPASGANEGLTIHVPLSRQIGMARRTADALFEEVLDARHANAAQATMRHCFEWSREGGPVDRVGFGLMAHEPFIAVRMVNVVASALPALLDRLGLAAEEPAISDTASWLSMSGRLGVNVTLFSDQSALVGLACHPGGRAAERHERVMDALEWRGLLDHETRASLTRWEGRDSARAERLRGTLLGRALNRLPPASEASFTRRISHFDVLVPSVAGSEATQAVRRTEAIVEIAVGCELTRSERSQSLYP